MANMKEDQMSNSSVQRNAEKPIRDALSKKLGFEVGPHKKIGEMEIDGFSEGNPLVCVEIFAHQGPSKAAQRSKIMTDLCKLLLAEKKLGKQCRKIFVVSDKAAISHLKGSWHGEFAKKFNLEIRVVDIDDELREEILQAQKGQDLRASS